MRKKRLIELAKKNEDWIYNDVAITLSRKIFISKTQIRLIENTYLRYDLYDEITKYFSIWQYFYFNQDEIKKILVQEFWWLNRFNLAYEDWKMDALAFVFSYHLKQIIKDI